MNPQTTHKEEQRATKGTTSTASSSIHVLSTARCTGTNLNDPQLTRRATKSLSQPSSSSRHTSPKEKGSSNEEEEMENLSRKSQWIVLALASGGCAAFNGVFAKLTTTELTTNFATRIANLIGLSNVEGGVEVVVRAIFFGLNLIFNGIMWALFTKALARGTSTTQVSILNTSANFMLTAVLGWMIFSESLPPLWFVGAALLVAGNVIIGRREEGEGKDGVTDGDVEHASGRDDEEDDLLLQREGIELDTDVEGEEEEETRNKSGDHDEDILDLGLDDEEDVGKSGYRGRS